MAANAGIWGVPVWIAGLGGAAVLATGAYVAGVFTPELSSPEPGGTPVVQTEPLSPVEVENVAAPKLAPVDETAPERAEVVETPAPVEAEEVAVAEPKPEPTPLSEPEPPALIIPDFDLVRVEPDGNTLVAGSAEPDAEVVFFLDQIEIGRETAGRDGKFAGFLMLAPSANPRVLSLRAILGDRSVDSEDQIILAPQPSVQVAQAEPQVAPEPENSVVAPPVDDQTATLDPSADDTSTSQKNTTDPAPEVVAETPRPTEAEEPESTPVIAVVDDQTEPVAPRVTGPAEEETADVIAETTVKAASESTAETLADPAQQVEETPDDEVVIAARPEVAPAAPVQVPDTANTPPTAPVIDRVIETAPALPTAAQEPEPSVQIAQQPEPTRPEPEPSAENTASAPVLALTESTEPNVPSSDTAQPAQPAATPAPPPPSISSPVAVLRAGREGIQLLQPATPRRPDALDRISLDVIGYSESGNVQLSGRADGQSLVRVYLDNRAVADLPADEQGNWKGQLDGIAPGIYTLRLDEVNDKGAVVSRIETPFKREAPEVLNPPLPDTAPELAPLIRAVTVQQGDTLWAISRERYGDGVLYVRVFEANRENIRNPDLIYPGQVFKIPD